MTEFITALPEFLTLKHMCDLGGNHGFYTMALLDKNAQLRGTVCDLLKVAELARGLIAEMGLSLYHKKSISAKLRIHPQCGMIYALPV